MTARLPGVPYVPGGFEGAQAVREQRRQMEAEHQQAQQRRNEMNKRKSPMGITRAELRTEKAKDRVGRLNQKLDKALDEVGAAVQREALNQRGESAEAERSLALREKRGA